MSSTTMTTMWTLNGVIFPPTMAYIHVSNHFCRITSAFWEMSKAVGVGVTGLVVIVNNTFE